MTASGGWCSAATVPARRPCCRSRPAGCTRRAGTADLLGSRLGRVDVFELRPRIGLSSASLADRIPAGETRARRRAHRGLRRDRPLARGVRGARRVACHGPAGRVRRRPPVRPLLRHPQRGRAQARPDRPLAHDRPRAAAARRARRRPRPRRPRGAGRGARRAGRRPQVTRAGAGHAPRRGDPARLHAPPAAAPGQGASRPARSTRCSPPRPCRARSTSRSSWTSTDGRWSARAASAQG